MKCIPSFYIENIHTFVVLICSMNLEPSLLQGWATRQSSCIRPHQVPNRFLGMQTYFSVSCEAEAKEFHEPLVVPSGIVSCFCSHWHDHLDLYPFLPLSSFKILNQGRSKWLRNFSMWEIQWARRNFITKTTQNHDVGVLSVYCDCH